MKLDLVSKDLTCNISTDYSFPDLNSIKPQLIAESTKNARIAGEQFANDSQAKLGKIRQLLRARFQLQGGIITMKNLAKHRQNLLFKKQGL